MRKCLYYFSVLVCLFSLILLGTGCKVGPSSVDDGGSFIVSVSTPSNAPLEGVKISGGFDWESYSVTTNELGIAALPRTAMDHPGYLYLDGFFPSKATMRFNGRYTLEATPRRLRLIGSVEGKAVSFTAGLLSTLEYDGRYHLYAFDEQTVTEAETAAVRLAASSIRDFCLVGDTLWLATHSNGVFAYSLADPYAPLLLIHLAIPGTNYKLAVGEGLIAVGNFGNSNAIGIFSYAADGSFTELSRFGNYYVGSIAFIGDYLVVSSASSNNQPDIYDLSDPASPVLVYQNLTTDTFIGFVYGNQFIMSPVSAATPHKRLDLTVPAAPIAAADFVSDSSLIRITGETSAIGKYGSYVSFLQGNFADGFTTQALMPDMEFTTNGLNYSYPPYYVIDDGLRILEAR